MPHIVFECSEEILAVRSGQEIASQIHATVFASTLFNEQAIKIRVNPYQDYAIGGRREPFIHVFATIMPGRSVEQRAGLSRAVVETLAEMFPDVKHITMSISEFEKDVFFNRNMM